MLMQETGTTNDAGNLFSMTSSGPTTPQIAALNSTYLATTKELNITGIPATYMQRILAPSHTQPVMQCNAAKTLGVIQQFGGND